MALNFFKVTFRNIMKQKLYSLLNIAGLAVGIAASIIIFLFAKHELTYDQFHGNAETVHMVYKERITPNGIQPTYDTWAPLLNRLENEYPEVVNGTRLYDDNVIVESKGERFDGTLTYTDDAFFEVFDFTLAHGNQDRPFPNLNSLVISKAMAEKYFGSYDPIGQTLVIDFDQEYTISGILDDIPHNSSIQPSMLVLLASAPEYAEFENSWGGSFLYTYVQLRRPQEAETLVAKMPGLIASIWDEETQQRTNFKLLPLSKVYDTLFGNTQTAFILLYVALGLLVISCINFINLFTSSALERSKEVAVRKVIGARRSQLIFQYLGEAVFMSFISLALAIVIMESSFPYLNAKFSLDLFVDYNSWITYLLLASFTILLGLLSGAYPAFIMSRFGILDSFKGSAGKNLSKKNARDVMIVFQFFISVTLITGTLVTREQISYMQTNEMGFDKDDLLVIPLSLRDFEDRDSANVRVKAFKNEIAALSHVVSLSTSSHIPTAWSGSNLFVRPEGWEGNPLRMRFTFHDARFFETYGINTVLGNGFKDDSFGNQRESVVLNEAALAAFGWEEVENKKIRIGNSIIDVVGVIGNFNFETLQNEISPILHFHRTPTNGVHNYITVRTRPGTAMQVVEAVEDRWPLLETNLPFEYFFIDENVATMYQSENRLLAMTTIFAAVAIFIACLGLFGITSHSLEKRKKEIGIRKVLGASVASIFLLISRKFTLLVLLGFILSVPITIFVLNRWLQDYAYHITPSPWLFVVALLAILLMAMATLSFKTIQAGQTDPVKVLKDE